MAVEASGGATPGDRAIALLKTLLENGAWYSSAIELDAYTLAKVDGEQLEKDARQIVADAGIEWTRRS